MAVCKSVTFVYNKSGIFFRYKFNWKVPQINRYVARCISNCKYYTLFENF